MKLKVFLRPSLAIVFGFIGALIAKILTPADIFAISGNYFLIVASLAFGILGFILPELTALATRAGIAALASQIVNYLPRSADILSASNLPFRKKKKPNRTLSKYPNPIFVDTSALIDGRMLEIAHTGFLWGTFLVIPSVIAELHKLADSADDLRRARGRRGLDILAQLKREKKVKVEIVNVEPKGADVDNQLLSIAKQTKAKIITIDFNLNKVASVQGIEVLNLHELANAVKTAILPNQQLSIQIISVGKEKDQGVGYLPDGTMVVVENGAKLQGQTRTVTVQKVLATQAGKMVFAKIIS